MSTFRKNIRSAINDEAIQIALDKNAKQRLAARQFAYSDLEEDFEALKEKAHALRTETLANLDDYLEEFILKAGENGLIIHWASDAEDARKIVLEIAESHRAKLIAKAKTMMSEEIILNPALESAGMRVVETDLGEYIVQLRGEHPSHIITPAVHLRREDVGQTFHEKLGIPRTNHIETLTNTARSRLRQVFLEADIGISGVNMGVVETGDLCIVTNEGNGRMVTTLPKIHIALMGIERLVPDLDGLALIIKMLPRSATGQKITVYTQLITGPRGSDEVDGAIERHLVLIDNGRSRLRQTALAETLLCIRCGACINACPVFREIGGFSYTSKSGEYTPYPGPIGSALSPGLFGFAEFGHLAQASTLCGACKEACPMDIDLPTMLLRIRAGKYKQADQTTEKAAPIDIQPALSWGLKFYTWFSTRPRLFAASQKFAALIGKIWSPRSSWMTLPGVTGWGYSKDFPRPALTTFREYWKSRDASGGTRKTAKIAAVQASPTRHNSKGHGQQDTESLVARFEAELTSLNGVFIPCESEELSNQVVALLQTKKIDRILTWEGSHLPTGLASELQANGLELIFGGDPEIKAGLTGAVAAVAETGTVVLVHGPGRPASTSLLPDIHLAILQERDIYEKLPQVLHLREIQEASSTVLISGPSRTADIEMTLTIGVHGPEEIYVFCVKG